MARGLLPILEAVRPGLTRLVLSLQGRCRNARDTARILVTRGIGRCTGLRVLELGFTGWGLTDTDLAFGVLTPLVAGCPRIERLGLELRPGRAHRGGARPRAQRNHVGIQSEKMLAILASRVGDLRVQLSPAGPPPRGGRPCAGRHAAGGGVPFAVACLPRV